MHVPRSLELAAAVSWRLLVVGAAVVAAVLLLERLQVVLVGTLVAVLLACALSPGSRRLRARGVPPSLAALAMLIALLGSLAVAGWLVLPPAVEDVRSLDVNADEWIDGVRSWLVQGPLSLSEREVDRLFESAEARARGAFPGFLLGAWNGAQVAVEVVAGIVLSLVLAFFFLKDGDRMWRWICGFLPSHRRAEWTTIGRDVRDVLAGFIRGTAIVSLVDAVGIGIGLYLLGVPLVLPLALLTFVGGFIPIVGATVAGLLAVLVALVAKGPLTALAVLGVVLLVQQLEGNVLQPVIVGRSVRLHPAVIVLAVGAGAVLWGIVGALLAVPITAALATVLAHLRRGSRAPTPAAASVLEDA